MVRERRTWRPGTTLQRIHWSWNAYTSYNPVRGVGIAEGLPWNWHHAFSYTTASSLLSTTVRAPRSNRHGPFVSKYAGHLWQLLSSISCCIQKISRNPRNTSNIWNHHCRGKSVSPKININLLTIQNSELNKMVGIRVRKIIEEEWNWTNYSSEQRCLNGRLNLRCQHISPNLHILSVALSGKLFRLGGSFWGVLSQRYYRSTEQAPNSEERFRCPRKWRWTERYWPRLL